MGQKSKTETIPDIDTVTEDASTTTLPAEWDKGSNLPDVFRPRGAALEKSDILLPRLSLVQRVGDLSVIFMQGSWVLNREIQLTQKLEEPMVITVLQSPVKYYQEVLAYDPEGPRPRMFQSLEEVNEAKLTLAWGHNDERPTAEPVADVVLLISKPESVNDELSFSQQVKGIGLCALAQWSLVRTAYTRAAKRLFTAIALELGGKPIRHMKWHLQGVPIKVSGFNIFAPKLTPLGFWPEETIKDLDAKFTPPAAKQ